MIKTLELLNGKKSPTGIVFTPEIILGMVKNIRNKPVLFDGYEIGMIIFNAIYDHPTRLMITIELDKDPGRVKAIPQFNELEYLHDKDLVKTVTKANLESVKLVKEEK